MVNTIIPQGAVHEHRNAGDDRAHERQPLAEQDAGVAAEPVGDLADRVGHKEAADPEQADRQPGKTRRAGHRQHHQRADAVSKLGASADERLRQREQRRVAFDQRRDAARPGNRFVHLRVHELRLRTRRCGLGRGA
jgi:hypothetical protein